MIFLKLLFHISIFLVLTLLTQIGGLVYIISFIFVRKIGVKKKLKQLTVFLGLYLLTTFLLVPYVAPFFGREKISDNSSLKAHSFFYKLTNRNYVNPELNTVLKSVSIEFSKRYRGIKVVYLDANFPFINGFPLLPHLSHNDGKKIDISFVYEENSTVTNKKPTVSGYGVFENPKSKEYNQIDNCKRKGYWQYDFSKYVTFGTINKNIIFSNEETKELIQIILNQNKVGKLFIEPHLKRRLKLTNPKIRFHGCRAVRHDDHIHFQLK